MIPIILSGGSGSRLWPLSRKKRPKQFLPVIDDNTLFQSTVLRLDSLKDIENPMIVCNEAHRFMVAEELRQLGKSHQGIILEPVARNTAPAIALAALRLLKKNKKDDLLLVLPADHVIADIDAFQNAVLKAKSVAEKGYLVTFGIVATHPETGYGYIQKSSKSISDLIGAFPVERFVEKPEESQAKGYLNEGGYYWNSGMFVFKASRFLEELERYQPELVEVCQKSIDRAENDLDFIRIDKNDFSACESISADYAVMEKTSRAAVVPLDARWSDVGVWSAVWEIGKKDKSGNVVRGEAVIQQSNNNIVYAEKSLVALLGVDDLIVINTQDALLVAHKDEAQSVKNIVDQLKNNNRKEVVEHREVDRPWGTYDRIDGGERFQVKRITVKPGAKLSLQKHHHRAEHWIVVTGTAEVTCGDKTFLLTENQSTYIPLGAIHQLINPGKVPLELIEVQSGSYLREDDIVRIKDQYGRSDLKQ